MRIRLPAAALGIVLATSVAAQQPAPTASPAASPSPNAQSADGQPDAPAARPGASPVPAPQRGDASGTTAEGSSAQAAASMGAASVPAEVAPVGGQANADTESGTPAAAGAAQPTNAVPVAVAEEGPAAPGDAARGEAKAAACGACHGMDGNSADPQYPKLAGQHERFIARQLHLFKTDQRINPVMQPFAKPLSAQDMRDLGAYYAAKAAVPGVADETLAAKGASLYRGGDAERGIPACMACHGPAGRGNPGQYPAVAGQHADYTKKQLLQFRDGLVLGTGDDANAVMAGVAAYLSDEDIEALSTYLEGLYRADQPAAAKSTAP